MSEVDSTGAVEYRGIPGFPEWYRVGDDGTVWSCLVRGTRNHACPGRLGEWRQLRPGRSQHGHLTVAMAAVGGRQKSYHVHRLVLLAFVGEKPAGAHTRHLDGVPGNNRLENLVYGTPGENQADRVRHGTSNRGERHGLAKLTAAAVRRIRRLVSAGGVVKEVAKEFGVSPRAVRDVVTRKRWAHVE